MQKASSGDLLEVWGEAKQKLTDTFELMRQALGRLSIELDETERKLREVVTSVDGTLERLGVRLKNDQT